MKLLILTYYYAPDLSAGSFRSSALVKALLDARPDLELDVVTTLPNRYQTFSAEAPVTETSGRVTIHRIKVPAHRSGMADQARSFLTFAREARRLTAAGGYDLVYATSSRLMTAVLGAHLSRRLKLPLYLDIRDIFVDTVKDVLPRFAPVAEPVFGAVEKWAFGRARSINLVSRGFSSYFGKRYPKTRFTYFTNGVDDDFLDFDLVAAPSSMPLTVLYAGNIGEGQGLHTIVPELARRASGELRFRIFGDGGRLKQLIESLAVTGVSNVEVLPPIPRARLLEEYAAADILFLHLNDYPAFRKVLPSKLFEYAATGKPIWAGIAGHSAEFALAEIGNVAVFQPGDVEGGKMALSRLHIGTTDRSRFTSKFTRSSIMREMAVDILATAEM